MKSFYCLSLCFILLVLAAPPCWPAESPFIESLAKKQWGDLVRETEWATSAYVSKCFPGTEIYQVRLVNPLVELVGPPTRLATIALRGRDATFLRSDSDAAAYFANSKLEVKSAHDARIVAHAFADLRRYEIVNAPPGGGAASPANDWQMTTEASPTAWTVTYALLTDNHAGLCFRYAVNVSRKGEVSVKNVRHIHGMLYE